VIITSDEKRVILLRLLDDLFATGTRDDWVARLRGADIVAAPINTLLEASNDPMCWPTDTSRRSTTQRMASG